MKPVVYLIIGLLAALFTPLTLAQGFAYTRYNSTLWAGPGPNYPPIMNIHRGATVTIYGCLSDWQWCDVSWRGERGWISGNALDYSYSGRRVEILSYGAQIGLPILVFGFDSYWNSHYRGRPWYRNRNHWRSHQPPVRPQPRPQPGLHQQQRPPQHEQRPQPQQRPPQHLQGPGQEQHRPQPQPRPEQHQPPQRPQPQQHQQQQRPQPQPRPEQHPQQHQQQRPKPEQHQ